ncbi:glycosyltransferase [Kaistella sp. DKR-2]|uniref:glycosyltransferase n=1 Tax=Kaistella soli TaxID=2849654 RepID=UPI001C268706|nr:glycosyltransferase [Kaistella soli]MBU8883403.1 glycosyltransferase [Kaistella soli]
MRYKILFISSWFPNKIEPTNGNFVQRHAEAVSLLHDVEILHAIGDASQKENFLFDEQIINSVRTLIVYYRQTGNPVLNFMRRMKAYQKGFVRMKHPDLLHANVLHKSMLFAVYLRKKFKIPFVLTEHWSGFLKINRHKLSKAHMFVARKIAEKASFILPVSHYLLNDLKEIGFKNEMEVVENVVDTNLFHVKNQINEKLVFLHVSNLIKLKNPQKIINAAIRLSAEYSNFELKIGGDGDVETLNELIKNNRAENFITTFSMLTLPEVSREMRRSDCFILFSDYENFPCVLLESLSSGTPAIATKVGGIPEIINDKNGILISNSEQELYSAMKKVVERRTNFDDPEKLHAYVEGRFSMIKIAQKFDKIYRQVLN